MNGENQTGKTDISQHANDLINRSIDGELGAVEQQELDHLLGESQQLAGLYNELNGVAQILDETPELDPPEHLQSTIEKQIRLPVAEKSHETIAQKLNTLLSAAWVRTGFAISAAAVISIGIYQFGASPVPTEQTDDMVGTIIKKPAGNQFLLDHFDLDGDLLTGSVELRGIGDKLVMQVNLDSRSPSELVVNFGKPGLKFVGLQPQKGEDYGVTVTDDFLRIPGNGEQVYTLEFQRIDEPVSGLPMQVDFFAGESLIQSARMSVKQD